VRGQGEEGWRRNHPREKLLELVRLLPEGEIRFKLLDNHWVQILADRKTYKMVGMAKDNFRQSQCFPIRW